MSYPFDLGTHTRPVSDSAAAQVWFDRGLVWMYGFNHEEAIACFERALADDPALAIAHWGIAYALGPNYNKPWEVFSDAEKAETVTRAQAALAAGADVAISDLDTGLIAALRLRYPATPDVEDFQPYADAFATAMEALYAQNPGDLDLAAFTAEALMTRTPWQLWDLPSGAPATGASTKAAQAILETAFERPEAWDHPGLLHLYIHLMEMSPTPEAALRHGDQLTGLVPDAGHLVHMATHIDVLCGDYANVVARNYAASLVDDRFKAEVGGENFYALYRIHNLHFELYGAMFLAQKARSLDAAARLHAEVPDAVVRVYPELFETFVASRPHVLIRFGLWEAILDEPLPDDRELYAVTHALTLYARAVALANLGRTTDAEANAAAFDEAFAAIPEKRMLFQNTARDVLGVAEAMMQGEIAFKAGRRAEGLDHLRDAVHRDDTLMYEEPWAWPQPPRHALGALLMEAGEWAEAEAVFRADLDLDPTLPRALQNPQNIWALHGLHECLARRDETVERPHIAAQLARAQARADVPVKASCFCRAQAG